MWMNLQGKWLMKMNLAGNLFDNQRVDFEKVDILQQRMFHFLKTMVIRLQESGWIAWILITI